MDPSLTQWLQIASDTGGFGALVVVLYLFVGGRIVSANAVRELRRDRDDWREMALSGANAAERAVELARQRRLDRDRDAVDS